MDRPSKEEVDAAMLDIEPYEETDWSNEESSVPSVEQILEAEVRALREERGLQSVADEIAKAVIEDMRRELSECRSQLQRLATILDEAIGPQPVMPVKEMLTRLERKLWEDRRDLNAARENYRIASDAQEAAELRIVELRAELADANHWRERWCADYNAAAQRAQDTFEERKTLRATIARVEALPAKWREKADRPRSPLFSNAEHALTIFTFRDCAESVEEALRQP